MGIYRDSMYKRRATGGRSESMSSEDSQPTQRSPATKLFGGFGFEVVMYVKWHALRLDIGNYSWGSEVVTRKTRILDVIYNASNNEFVKTQTVVKSAIVQVDAALLKDVVRFKQS